MTETIKEYDKIGESYKKATVRPLRKYSYEPTIGLYLPEVKGKRVLDLACGDGIITRLIRDKGAREVVGLDLSEKMISLAKSQNSDRIKYFQRDCMNEDLREFGKFDVVTAMMFLHYAKSREEIEKSVKNIRQALSPNGTFCGMIVNPELVLTGNDSYGIKIPTNKKREGEKVAIELSDFEGNKFCEVEDYYWKKETFDQMFKKNGFATEWIQATVSQEGIEKYGKEFWKQFLDNPLYLMLRARIAGEAR